MLYNLDCFIPGDKNFLSIKIDKIEIVDRLKDAIKHKKEPELDAFAADALTLYRGAIDRSYHDKKARMNELRRLSEHLNECTELDDPLQELSEIFSESLPTGKIYVILVRIPEGESIYCGGLLSLTQPPWLDRCISLFNPPKQ